MSIIYETVYFKTKITSEVDACKITFLKWPRKSFIFDRISSGSLCWPIWSIYFYSFLSGTEYLALEVKFIFPNCSQVLISKLFVKVPIYSNLNKWHLHVWDFHAEKQTKPKKSKSIKFEIWDFFNTTFYVHWNIAIHEH